MSKQLSLIKLQYLFYFFLFIYLWNILGAGLSTIGLIGAGIGGGLIFSSFLLAFSRNPSLKSQLFPLTILGFSLTEAIGLFAIMISMLILNS